MADDPETLRMIAQMQALRAERDAALAVLDQHEREAEEQTRLLIEEQDRFVSRMIESHEREVGRLRLELDEARAAAAQFEHKLERDRASNSRLEEQLATAQVELTRVREQRDAARVEARRAQHLYVTSQAGIDALKAELELAQSTLADGAAPRQDRTSGVRPPPLPIRRDATKLAVGATREAPTLRDSVPPSSR